VKRLIWSPRSIRDLESIHHYIAQDSLSYADLVVQRLVLAPERLRQFPESGRVVPERGQPELRELIALPGCLSWSGVELRCLGEAARPRPQLSAGPLGGAA
jgi:plasmid stabilization system protein ParE